MGEISFVNQSFVKTKVAQQKKRPKVDWILVGVTIGLTLFGLLMVYSAGTQYAAESDYFLTRQATFAGVGIVAALILSRFNYRYFQKLTVLMMGITLIMLVATTVIGDRTFGANRSLLNGSVRPSELAKLVVIIYVAVWLASRRDVLNDMFMGLFPLMIILGVTAGLIFLQPDLSASITIIILGGLLFFLAGGAYRQIALTLAVALFFVWLIVLVYPTGMQRVVDYWAGLNNPLNASYHVQRSLGAIISGGLFGVGIGHGSTKFTGLPVAHTDSIFAVIAEELGLLGTGLVILAFTLLLWRGLRIAQNAPDHFGMLLASGITIWIVVEALLNMAVMVNLLPQAGNALPFISYGGSNLTMTLAGIGILMNIARQSSGDSSKQGGNAFGAVVDLRWRDRGRRVSRSGNLPGTRK
jgi:cell division protein FtsW